MKVFCYVSCQDVSDRMIGLQGSETVFSYIQPQHLQSWDMNHKKSHSLPRTSIVWPWLIQNPIGGSNDSNHGMSPPSEGVEGNGPAQVVQLGAEESLVPGLCSSHYRYRHHKSVLTYSEPYLGGPLPVWSMFVGGKRSLECQPRIHKPLKLVGSMVDLSQGA